MLNFRKLCVFCQMEIEGTYRLFLDAYLRPINRYEAHSAVGGTNAMLHASRHNEERRTPQLTVSKLYGR
jgi:hypothetical protein